MILCFLHLKQVNPDLPSTLNPLGQTPTGWEEAEHITVTFIPIVINTILSVK